MKNITAIDLFPDNGFRGFGKLGLENETAGRADFVFTQFISSTIGLITIIAIIWFVIIFILGAVGFISSGGDKNAIESSKKKIMNGLIGIVFVILGMLIINFIGTLIGLPDILDFGVMFNKLTIGK